MKIAPRNNKKHRLAFKMALLILVSTTLIFTAAFVYNYWCSTKIVFHEVEEKSSHLTAETVNKIETVLQSIEKVPRFLSAYIENQPMTKEMLQRAIGQIVSLNEEIFGSTIAYEPFSFDPQRRFFAPYAYIKDKNLVFTELGSDTYDYFTWDWYLVPKELNQPVWSEPYYDEGGGNIMMSTFSVPFYHTQDNTRSFQGVVTADISLEWLVNIVSSVKLFESGYAFLISKNGVFITHPSPGLIMRESIFSLAEQNNDDRLREIGRKMVHEETGFVPYSGILLHKKSWLYYAPIPSNGWSLGIVFPEDELFANIRSLSQTVLLIGITGFVILFLVVVFISGVITKPIRTLAATTTEIAKGNLDVQLPASGSNDEVGDLSRSFENMRVALKEYIANLTETTAAKERIESELKIARNIQMNFLPKKFPPFPEKSEFDIFATLEPAKEVGGDMYDFFLLDGDRLFFSIGDVADKGVPAALFMAVSKTLMKGIAEHVSIDKNDPAEILMRVNDELSRDNETSMFITVICAILDLKTGILFYSNAAHNPPVLIRANQRPQWLDLPGGFLLGPMAGMKYETRELQLHPGDQLLFYTDGVDEAQSVQSQFYTKPRILETLASAQAHTAEELVVEMMDSVKHFTEGAAQSDDITILALTFRGVESSSKKNS